MRDEPYFPRPPLAGRVLGFAVAVLAMPFLVVAGLVRSIFLAVLPALTRALAIVVTACLVIAGVFAYHHDWNSAAQAAVITIGFSLIYFVLSRIMVANSPMGGFR
jgi:hypothetical protein